MIHRYDAEFGSIMMEPASAEGALEMLRGIAIGYDGMDGSIEGMRQLVDELVEYAGMAIDFMREGKVLTDEQLYEDTYWAAKAEMEAHAAEWKVGKQNDY